ncbi:pyochelin biosynthetic protein PchC [Streptacidiphilus sp. MAP12-33]|uniref:thioesterase II family protein n=1 Tax=Streptacidiphilus sp. MAP12-33 TaxID=3156266 RepID=UPI0035188C17
MTTPLADRSTRWTRSHRPKPAAPVRLVCLPHAGGAASAYRDWDPLLPDDVELTVVQYPGRQERIHEPCIDSMEAMADEIAAVVRPQAGRDLVLFGHSMGAAVAYEVAVRHAAEGHPPRQLIVSGRMAPHRQVSRDVHVGGNEALVAELRRMSATDPAVLADPELLALLLPAIRADYALIERYRPEAPARIPTPITVFRGRTDESLPAHEVDAWRELTARDFGQQVFEGGHFYLQVLAHLVVPAVVRAVRAAREGSDT